MANASRPRTDVFGKLLVWLLVLVSSISCTNPDLEVEKDFELSRFSGKWHEIARIPRDYDELCHDTTAEYRQTGAHELELHHSCRMTAANGVRSESRASASVDDPSVPAKLSLQIGLYTGAYWILDTGANYEYAVIGHPSRLMLWILAREPKLDDVTWHKILNATQKQGFSSDLLRKTPQSEAQK